MTKSTKHNKGDQQEPESTDAQQEFTFDEEKSFGSGQRFKFWFLAVVLLGIGAVVAGLYWSQTIKVDRVEVYGTELADKQDILGQAEYTVGMKRDSVSMIKVMKQVETVEFVRSANVSISLNGTMELEIDERQPLALLADNSPKVWVDREGVILPMKLGFDINIPLLRGFSGVQPQDTLDSQAFREVTDFLTKARKDPFTWSTVSEVLHKPGKGVIAISNESNVRLIFGTKEFDRKMKYWKAYYAQVLKHKQQPEHREIDLRFEGQIVAR